MARKVFLNAFCRRFAITATVACLLQMAGDRHVSAQTWHLGDSRLSSQMSTSLQSDSDMMVSLPNRFASDTQIEFSADGQSQDPFAMAWFLSVLSTGLISFYRRTKSSSEVLTSRGFSAAEAA